MGAVDGVGFAPEVCWRVSKRGLVIAGVDGDALLLEHPRAADLPDLLADTPAPAALAERLGDPNGDALVTEMLEIGILTATPHSTRVADPTATPPSPSNAEMAAAPDRVPPADPTATPPGTDDHAKPDAADAAGTAPPDRAGWAGASRSVVFTRSGAEFPGIERPARWLNRRLVPVLLSWPGRILLVAIVAAGVVALVLGRPDGPAVSAHPAADALLGLIVMLVLAAAHELAHAVALVHYGRRPRRAGFGFYWGGISFYVDSTEALTLPRRQRVTQALVGLGVDAVTVSLLAITAHLSSTVLLVAVAWRLAVIGVADLVVNALPILEVDGHWALADYLDEPELAPRARTALGAALRRQATGGETSQRWLAAYGAASVLGGLGLLAGSALVWWAVAADLIRALFAGNPAEIVIGIVLVGPVALSLLASALGLLLETLMTATVDPQNRAPHSSPASAGTSD